MSTNPFASLARNSTRPAPAAAGPAVPQDPVEPAQPAAASETREAANEQVAEQTPPQPIKRAMITGHSNHRVSAMFAGLLGEVKEDSFTLDRRYQDVCYLFTLGMQGAANLEQGMRLAEIEFPSARQADQFFFNMLGATARQWDKMYEGAATVADAGDLVGNMLGAERAMVKNGAERLINAAGLTRFAVPVRAEAFVAEPYEGVHPFETEQQLLGAARYTSMLTALDISEERPVVPVAEQAAPGAEQAGPAAETPLDQQHRGHNGAIEMMVLGSVTVMATDAQTAAALAVQLLEVSNKGVLQNLLTVTPERIENLTLMPREASTDDDGDDGRAYPNTRIGY